MERRKQEIIQKIEQEKLKKAGFFSEGPSLFFLTENKNIIGTDTPSEVVIRESQSKKSYLLWLPIIILVMAGVGLGQDLSLLDTPTKAIGIPAFVIGISGSLLYFYFKNGDLFKMNQDGILIGKKQEVIPW